jgi:lipopolysaccharide/colanic/teichoic acid biosynthesis glycosyltransferase
VGHALSATQVAGVQTVAARAASWPMADLWPRLGVPTPLWKRSLDIVVASTALLLLSPLFAMIAIAIRCDSPGPVIFRQMRAGRGGRAFVIYKFRSMIQAAEEKRAALAAQNEQDGPVFKIRLDPRTTRVGRWIRRWSVDELPQLWNVLKGDISLVGPRSPTFDEVCKYERWQRRRLSVTGGITCIWQVSGRSQISFREWMRMDMRYVACRSPWLDLRLLVMTLPAVLSGRGAC